jgi:hypothetical protein
MCFSSYLTRRPVSPPVLRSYPKSAGDIPYAYHHKPGDQCVDPVTKAYIKCQVCCCAMQYSAVHCVLT